MIRHVDASAWTSSSARRGCDGSSSQPTFGSVNGVVSAPGSPKTWHSQYTRVPAMCEAIDQICQPADPTGSASCSGVSGAIASISAWFERFHPE